MSNRDEVTEILRQILDAAEQVERRFTPIRKPTDFRASDEGRDRLDAIAMMLIAIGESLKRIDKIAGEDYLASYSGFDWKGAKGIRDVMSHQYFDVDLEVVFETCRDDNPKLIRTINTMLNDLESAEK